MYLEDFVSIPPQPLRGFMVVSDEHRKHDIDIQEKEEFFNSQITEI